MRKYRGIDIGRLLFASLIPFLHIAIPKTYIVQQYISRLGVPYFFAVSGMFLAKKLESGTTSEAWKLYTFKIGKLLTLWLIIYIPLILLRSEFSLQYILFKTPAYLWYLTALLVASIPFCFIKNRRFLFICAAVLYIIGTLFGETYKWMIGGAPHYENIFLTTRNGIFFALPLMCVGELTWKRCDKSWFGLFLTGILLIAEITYVGLRVEEGADRSMYLTLPIFMFYLVLAFKHWNPKFHCEHCRGISAAIYLMQYGVISITQKILASLEINAMWTGWLTYITTLLLPVGFYMVIREKKIAGLLFN